MSINRILPVLLFMLLVTVGVSPAAAAELPLKNGSFEEPDAPDGEALTTLFDMVDNKMPGWDPLYIHPSHVSGVYDVNGSYYPLFLWVKPDGNDARLLMPPSCPDGNQLFYASGYGNRHGQVIEPIEPNMLYTVTYWLYVGNTFAQDIYGPRVQLWADNIEGDNLVEQFMRDEVENLYGEECWTTGDCNELWVQLSLSYESTDPCYFDHDLYMQIQPRLNSRIDDFHVYKDRIPYCGRAVPGPIGDLNMDCIVDMHDVRRFTRDWLECTDPLRPDCL
jgi:hypothetical protein